jgi:hypothetical protein
MVDPDVTLKAKKPFMNQTLRSFRKNNPSLSLQYDKGFYPLSRPNNLTLKEKELLQM